MLDLQPIIYEVRLSNELRIGSRSHDYPCHCADREAGKPSHVPAASLVTTAIAEPRSLHCDVALATSTLNFADGIIATPCRGSAGEIASHNRGQLIGS
jgi:hypothetical protein